MAPIIVDKEAKRKQILKAARRVFARNGFYKATIADIAAEAGIGKGTVYEYFPDKRELFRGCFKYFLEEIEDQVERQVAAITDPTERIRGYIQAVFRGYLKQSDAMELLLIFWAEAVQNREMAWRDLIIEVYDKAGAWLERIVEEGMEAGVFRRVDTKSFSSVIIAAMDGLGFQWIIYRDRFDVDRAAERLADLAVYLLQANNQRVLFPFIW